MKRKIKESEPKVVDATLPRTFTGSSPSEKARYSPIGKSKKGDQFMRDAELLKQSLRKIQDMYPGEPDFAAHLADVRAQIEKLENKAFFHYDQNRKAQAAPRYHAQASLPPAMESFTSEKELLEDLKKNLNI